VLQHDLVTSILYYHQLPPDQYKISYVRWLLWAQ